MTCQPHVSLNWTKNLDEEPARDLKLHCKNTSGLCNYISKTLPVCVSCKRVARVTGIVIFMNLICTMLFFPDDF